MTARRRPSHLLAGGTLALAALACALTTAAPGHVVVAASVPYVVPVDNGGFEAPAVTASTKYEANPSSGSWRFNGTAGVSLAGSTYMKNVPAIPEGTQVGYVQNAGKVVQRTWVDPGDTLTFKASQSKDKRTGLQSIAVVVDGVRQGQPIVPADGSWGTYSVALTVSAPQLVNLEIRGLSTGSKDNRTALLDAVSIARVASTIPDGGLPAQVQRGIMNEKNTPLSGGVLGVLKTGDSESGLDTPVQAFAEWNGIVYVGGKFANVQRGAGAPLENQAYLAAFDRNTGAWIDTFRPVLDGTVWDLAVTPDGRLVVGGQFTKVNGVANTAGLAELDPVTGQVVPGWTASLQITGSTARPYVRSIDIVGDAMFVGGNFSRVVGTDGLARSAGRLAKLSLTTGRPVAGFTANIGGTLIELDATPTGLYVVGKFTTVNGTSRTSYAVIDPVTGQLVPGHKQMLFTTTTAANFYQQAVLARGADVWIGGSEHSSQLYTASDTTRKRIFTSSPYGDVQAFAEVGGYLYAGSHASPGTDEYTDATDWTTLAGWTTRDPVRWIAVYDLENTTYVPTFTPGIGTESSEGVWELFVDTTGCLWAGGDISRGSSTTNGFRYARGFAKFCPVDDVAPTVPGSPSATGTNAAISLSWAASADDRAGDVTYEVLRNDRVVASGLTKRVYVDNGGVTADRYFVRAVDAAGNRSATTTVVTVGVDTSRPTVPKNVTATPGADNEAVLSWTASTDNVGVTGYRIYSSGALVATVATPGTTLTAQPTGRNSYQVSAIDAAGNASAKTASVEVMVTGVDSTSPRTPTNLAASQVGADVVLTWTAPTDNVGVTGYDVYQDEVVVATVADATATITSPAPGLHRYAVQAFDAAGNRSRRTAEIDVTVT